MPPLGFENNEAELRKINDIITKAHPDLLIVCLGCPKQEKWIYENYRKYDAKVSLCAGATVDFLAGSVKRAPRWMSEHGLDGSIVFCRNQGGCLSVIFQDC